MFSSNEATNKDLSLKMQMILSLDKDDSTNSEKIWKAKGFFGDQKGDSIIKKPNFLENTLAYCNEGTISTLKTGDYAIYLDYAIPGQIIPANNSPPDLDNYVLKENEVILNIRLYNTKTGHFRGVKKWLAFIMIQGDPDEVFSHMDMMKEDQKFCIQALNVQFLTFFKELLLKNMLKC